MSGTELASVRAEAQDYVRQAKAANTLRAYQADWRHFTAWCAQRDRKVLPATAETVALYLTELARDHRVSTDAASFCWDTVRQHLQLHQQLATPVHMFVSTQ